MKRLWNSVVKVVGGSATPTEDTQLSDVDYEDDWDQDSLDEIPEDKYCENCDGVRGMQYCPECHRVDPYA